MALIGKREDLIHVPWLSVEEWLEVYKQIYSGDLAEQSKAYEILLVWKARIPKLPVGVECTLGLVQVCLRDREWMPKIYCGDMSISYENDLRMMYSTVIMKFLNHISNIAHTKQASLFIIAKQLNIPDWIVDLRHNIAHGHELPSIDVMRIVANILLTWLHEEYWAAEAKHFQETEEHDLDIDYKDEENLIDLIELWTAIGLYIKTKHVLISDLPDTEIRETLKTLFSELNVTNLDTSNEKSFSVNDDTELSVILKLLLSEISKNFSKGNSLLRRGKVIIDAILSNDAFLTSSEILSIFLDEESRGKIKNCLPQSLIEFWKDIILLLQEKKILLTLLLELIEVIKKEKDSNKKLLAALWLKVIAQAFSKQKIARHIYQTLEQQLDENNKVSVKVLVNNVEREIEKSYPEMKNFLNLNINADFPNCLTDMTFIKKLVLNCQEYSEHYLPEILKISSFLDCDSDAKEKLLTLMKLHSLGEKSEAMELESTEQTEKIYTIEDLKNKEKNKKSAQKKPEHSKELADCKIRNTNWKIELDKYDWSMCPIGVLPWQINDYSPNEPLTIPASEIRYAIVKNLELPKIVDSNKLKQHSKIQWKNLLKKKKKTKKKARLNETTTTTSTNVTDQASENVQLEGR